MFDQTFVSTEPESAKRFSVAASLLIQAAAVIAVLLISLTYTQALPLRQLRSLLYVPKPPVTVRGTEQVHHASASNSHRLFSVARVPFQLVVAPPRLSAAQPEAPDVSGSTGDALNGIPDVFNGPAISAKAPAPTAPPEPKNPKRLARVGGEVAAANLLHSVVPEYPTLAKLAHIQGAVEFTAIIGKDGTVQHLQLVRGHPLLVQAATTAILKWRYRPTLLNGVATEVMTDITVHFSLSQ